MGVSPRRYTDRNRPILARPSDVAAKRMMAVMGEEEDRGRGLLSSTFQLNVSAFCAIGDAFSGCLGGVQWVSGGIRWY